MKVKELITQLKQLDPEANMYRLVQHPYDLDEVYLEDFEGVGYMDLAETTQLNGEKLLVPKGRRRKNIIPRQIVL